MASDEELVVEFGKQVNTFEEHLEDLVSPFYSKTAEASGSGTRVLKLIEDFIQPVEAAFQTLKERGITNRPAKHADTLLQLQDAVDQFKLFLEKKDDDPYRKTEDDDEGDTTTEDDDPQLSFANFDDFSTAKGPKEPELPPKLEEHYLRQHFGSLYTAITPSEISMLGALYDKQEDKIKRGKKLKDEDHMHLEFLVRKMCMQKDSEHMLKQDENVSKLMDQVRSLTMDNDHLVKSLEGLRYVMQAEGTIPKPPKQLTFQKAPAGYQRPSAPSQQVAQSSITQPSVPQPTHSRFSHPSPPTQSRFSHPLPSALSVVLDRQSGSQQFLATPSFKLPRLPIISRSPNAIICGDKTPTTCNPRVSWIS